MVPVFLGAILALGLVSLTLLDVGKVMESSNGGELKKTKENTQYLRKKIEHKCLGLLNENTKYLWNTNSTLRLPFINF